MPSIIILLTKFPSSSSSRQMILMLQLMQLNNCKVLRSCGSKPRPNHHPSTSMQSCLFVCLFLQQGGLCIMSNISTLVSPAQVHYCRNLVVYTHGMFANLMCAAMFFVERRGFLLAALPNQPCIPSSSDIPTR